MYESPASSPGLPPPALPPRRPYSACPAACLAPALRAQSVDYSGFEQLFGEPVTTSATGKPQRMSEVPANMEIITADDIRRSGADNIPDILQFVAGSRRAPIRLRRRGRRHPRL